jgi:hypothetical protein
MKNHTQIQNISEILTYQQGLINSVFGKISVSIYFYQLSRLEDNRKYEKLAEKYLDEVMAEIDTVKEIDVKNGLSGIGLGINYLVKKGFVSGNINSILQEADDYLFRIMSVPKYFGTMDVFTMIQVLYYFYIRLQDQKKCSENEYLFRELCIKTINNIYPKIEKTLLRDRSTYNIEYYVLPLFLYVLSRIYVLDFYNVRITNILKELSSLILSTIPLLHSNKLYLLWGMTTISEQVEITSWDTHIQLLKRELDLDKIVTKELKNRNIFFDDGVVSIFLLAENVKKYLGEEKVCAFQQRLFKKIDQSEVWHLLETNPQYFNMHCGLYDGFCGLALLLMTYTKK